MTEEIRREGDEGHEVRLSSVNGIAQLGDEIGAKGFVAIGEREDGEAACDGGGWSVRGHQPLLCPVMGSEHTVCEKRQPLARRHLFCHSRRRAETTSFLKTAMDQCVATASEAKRVLQ